MLLVLGATEFPLKYYFTKRPINGDKLLNWSVNYMMFPDLVYFCDAGIPHCTQSEWLLPECEEET